MMMMMMMRTSAEGATTTHHNNNGTVGEQTRPLPTSSRPIDESVSDRGIKLKHYKSTRRTTTTTNEQDRNGPVNVSSVSCSGKQNKRGHLVLLVTVVIIFVVNLPSVAGHLMTSPLGSGGPGSFKYSTNVVKTKYGPLRGIVLRSHPVVEAYLGVPYATPPVGSLRLVEGFY